MPAASRMQVEDAKRILPPAAHKARQFVDQNGALVDDLNRLRMDLDTCLSNQPHNKAEILRLVETLKKRAMTLHGQAVEACQTIKDGR